MRVRTKKMMPTKRAISRESSITSKEFNSEFLTAIWGEFHILLARLASEAMQKAPSRLMTPVVAYLLPPRAVQLLT